MVPLLQGISRSISNGKLRIAVPAKAAHPEYEPNEQHQFIDAGCGIFGGALDAIIRVPQVTVPLCEAAAMSKAVGSSGETGRGAFGSRLPLLEIKGSEILAQY